MLVDSMTEEIHYVFARRSFSDLCSSNYGIICNFVFWQEVLTFALLVAIFWIYSINRYYGGRYNWYMAQIQCWIHNGIVHPLLVRLHVFCSVCHQLLSKRSQVLHFLGSLHCDAVYYTKAKIHGFFSAGPYDRAEYHLNAYKPFTKKPFATALSYNGLSRLYFLKNYPSTDQQLFFLAGCN